MKKMNRRLFILSLVLSFALSLLSAQNDGRTLYAKSDSKLNDVYGKLLRANKSHATFLKNLRNAQRKWIQFRNAQFALEYPQHVSFERAGPIPMDQAMCLVRLTDERTKTLLELLKISGDHETNGSGYNNYAAEFDGQTAFIKIPGSPSQQPTALTIELYVWFDRVNEGFFPLLAEANRNQWNSASGFSITYERDEIHWKLATQPNLAFPFIRSFSLMPKRWYHIACTYDGSVGSIYVDSILIYEGAKDVALYYGSGGFWIGHALNSLYGGDAFFKGRMDEIRIWNRARTKEEILANMKIPLWGNEPGLIGYWNFDSTPDYFNPVEDHSPSHVDGVLNGNCKFVRSTAFR